MFGLRALWALRAIFQQHVGCLLFLANRQILETFLFSTA